jgi:thiosulfate/3-mercaptopyruvate sulfurtransferase
VTAPAAPLVDAAGLRAALSGPAPPALVDVRWSLGGPPGRDAYDAGHIPGAVFADLETELSGPHDPPAGRHPLPAPAALQDALRAWGVRERGALVVYDDGPGLSAARAWWLARWAGIDDARLLDGGLAAWVAAGGETTTAVPRPPRGDVVVRAGGMPTLGADDAAALARSGVLLDARAAERYRGGAEPVDPVAGHVPGALSAPTAANVGPDGCFLAPGALRERFAALGVGAGTAVGVYCGSGVTAAHEVLALELAGVRAALYAPSWSGWLAEGRPVATGGEPG